MKRRCFAMSPDNRMVELPPDWLPERLAMGGGPIWIDLEEYDDEELATYLASLNLNVGAVQASAKAEGRTRVSLFGEQVFFELSALASGAGSELVSVAFLCTPDLCITMHRGTLAALASTADALTQNVGLAEASTAQLASTLLAGLLVPIVDGVSTIRRRVLKLQDEMDRDPDSIDLGEILESGSALRNLDSVTDEHVACFEKLRLLESSVLDTSTSGAFQTVLSDAQYLDRVEERLERRLTSLRSQYGMNQQDRMNRRLALLTVISAIFLPMTLIAGIYGMNFDVMPELHFPLAYPLVLVSMVLIATGLIWFFRSRGWFK